MMTLLALWQSPAEPEAEAAGPSFIGSLFRFNGLEIISGLLGLGVFLGLSSLARRRAPRREFWIVAALLPCWSMTYALSFRILHLTSVGFLRGALATLIGAAIWAAMRSRSRTEGETALPYRPFAMLVVPISSFVLLLIGLEWLNLSVNWTLVVPVLQLAAIGVASGLIGSRAPAPTFEAEESQPASSAAAQEPPPRPQEEGRASRGARLFISYRREDSAYISDRINERLTQRFGRRTVFKDVDSIPLGQDFRKHLREAVGGCDVLLAVIGKEWLAVDPQSGARRIDDPRDHLRIEVESALERDIPVIPVLVQGATVPSETDLPESLRPLAYRNAQQIRPDPDFNNDMDRLLRGIEQLLGR